MWWGASAKTGGHGLPAQRITRKPQPLSQIKAKAKNPTILSAVQLHVEAAETENTGQIDEEPEFWDVRKTYKLLLEEQAF